MSRMTAPFAEQEPLAFAQLLLGLIDEGRRTATYKLALLLALLYCSLLQTDADGQPSSRISTRTLAARVIHLYWPQVRPFSLEGGPTRVLSQSSQNRAVTVDAVARLRALAGTRSITTLHGARSSLPAEYGACLDTVELNFVQMPLGKLQRPAGVVGDGYPRFLYDDGAFTERVSLARLRAHPHEVELEPGVAEALVSLGGLIRPLLELHWTREVARFNASSLAEDRLRDHLFGASRVSLQRVLPGLTEIQHGRCFYCHTPLSRGQSDVDHFIPWSRVPNDTLANLVVAHRRCNGAKRDHFAALHHLEAFAGRHQPDLVEIAESLDWPLHAPEAHRTAISLYAHLPVGSQLWLSPGVYEGLDPTRRQRTLALLATSP